MRMGTLAGMTAGMGLLVSPDHLRLWGNLAGQGGPRFWLATLAAAGLYTLTVQGYSRLADSRTAGTGYLPALRDWGGNTAVAVALASRLVLMVGLLSGILVSAGFVFNETFVYWFPNFGFALACLAVTAGLLFWGYRVAEGMQIGLLAIVLAGLSTLIVAGYVQMGSSSMAQAPAPAAMFPVTLCGALVLCVGFDLGIHHSGSYGRNGTKKVVILAPLMVMVPLLSLWGAVSLAHVPADQLASSFIPHTLAARQIGGQTGRVLIGIVVIAGTLCASLTLLSAVARIASDLAKQNLGPRFFAGTESHNRPSVTLAAVVVAALLTAGFAGQPELEVFIRAGLLLWLLHIALVHLAAAGTARRRPGGAQGRRPAGIHIPAALLVIAGGVCLWLAESQRILLTVYLLGSWLGAAAIVYGAQRHEPGNHWPGPMDR